MQCIFCEPGGSDVWPRGSSGRRSTKLTSTDRSRDQGARHKRKPHYVETSKATRGRTKAGPTKRHGGDAQGRTQNKTKPAGRGITSSIQKTCNNAHHQQRQTHVYISFTGSGPVDATAGPFHTGVVAAWSGHWAIQSRGWRCGPRTAVPPLVLPHSGWKLTLQSGCAQVMSPPDFLFLQKWHWEVPSPLMKPFVCRVRSRCCQRGSSDGRRAACAMSGEERLSLHSRLSYGLPRK